MTKKAALPGALILFSVALLAVSEMPSDDLSGKWLGRMKIRSIGGAYEITVGNLLCLRNI